MGMGNTALLLAWLIIQSVLMPAQTESTGKVATMYWREKAMNTIQVLRA